MTIAHDGIFLSNKWQTQTLLGSNFIGSNFTFSLNSDYTHIENALIERAISFIELEKEILAFRPLAIEEFKKEFLYDEEIERLRKLNPSKPSEELVSLIEYGLKCNFDKQREIKFADKLAVEQTQINILAHALCEAVINVLLETCLHEHGLSELFTKLEMEDILQKWTEVPKLFIPNYKFPKGKVIYYTLTILCEQRNRLAHFKANVKTEHNSQPSKRQTIPKIIELQKKFLKLPYDLLSVFHNLVPGVP